MAGLRIEGTAEEVAIIAAALRDGLPNYGKRLDPPPKWKPHRHQHRPDLRLVEEPEPLLPGFTAGGEQR